MKQTDNKLKKKTNQFQFTAFYGLIATSESKPILRPQM